MLLLLLNLQPPQSDKPVSLGGWRKPPVELLQVPDWREEIRMARVRRNNEIAVAVIVAALTSGMLDG